MIVFVLFLFGFQLQGIVLPESVRPFPKANARDMTKKRRKAGRSAIYTDTPEKNAIAMARKLTGSSSAKRDLISEKMTYTPKSVKQRKTRAAAQKDSSDSSNSADELNILNSMRDEGDDSSDDVAPVSDDEEAPNINNLEPDDHVLVTFESKKQRKCFVGRVVEIYIDRGELLTKFMRRLPAKQENVVRASTFAFPEIDDISVHPFDDVLCKLPVPTSAGGTARCRNQYRFYSSILRKHIADVQ